MTQTIRNVTKKTDDTIAVDIYSHPNNSGVSVDHPESRYRYTVYAMKFTIDDLVRFIKDTVDFENDDSFEELQHIISCFGVAAKEGCDFIWRCSSENGHDDYIEFHPLKNDGEYSLLSQTC